MTSFSQDSERRFSEYLTKLGLFWDYEKAWGPMHPDFTVYSDSKKENIIAVIELEDIKYNKHELNTLTTGHLLVTSGSPYSRIREKINTARKQLRFSKDYPCVLVINDTTRPVPPESIIYGSMFGDLSISIPLRQKYANTRENPYNFFGPNGKMINQKSKEPQNTTIAAVAFMSTIQPDIIRSGVNLKLKELLDGIPDSSTELGTKEYFKRAREVINKVIKKGYDLNKNETCVGFYENPFCRHQFPSKMFSSGYTSITQFDLSSSKIISLFDWSQ